MKKPIDIVDIKKAVKDGEMEFYTKETRLWENGKSTMCRMIYCKSKVEECVLVGQEIINKMMQ